ncbi:uncharacterized protein FIBRA_03556 [Fibroporia radiculosa]|uniref:Methylthioribose-1-phosphate isomerase n=1 Tax=Fibroporia radiculosa TaxID=599839 RepID=J4HW21_9APHY|nr:uncharacterized protein FIBRA_03556 [Fibroporia radiculosa]CCM01502.1 predicted protein [Fibroporia radiculosa]
MTFERVPLDCFPETFSTAIELSSVALGGSIISVSDEFFAEAFHLLLVEPPPSLKGQFGPKGALYSGWESRRHNPTYDWCILKLGTTGSIFGFDVDTTHFNGNEAPQVSVQALYLPDGSLAPQSDDPRWSEILPRVDLGPSSRHLFKINPTTGVNYVKLNMYPDGGIARFRVYGLVAPVFPADASKQFDLAHVFSGGRVVFTSDQHFGVGSNLIIPGRGMSLILPVCGKDMGDGWETKRSRKSGHKDWAIIKLGDAGHLSHVVIDTAHFKGNFPESCELHALTSDELVPQDAPEDRWSVILPRTKLGPHREHSFQLENVDDVTFTHVRITIYPDGGIKRIRVFGRRTGTAATLTDTAVEENVGVNSPQPAVAPSVSSGPATGPGLLALPLTAEAFAPFGQVVQAYDDVNAVPAPRTTRVTDANQGTAKKFHKLAPIAASYPPGTGATAGLSVYRCQPTKIHPGGRVPVTVLERHPYTNQAFIPMGSSEELRDPASRYLVVVAKNGGDDRPDMKSLRAFVASAGQGIVYNTGVWHQPMTVLDKPMDLTCVETQIGNGDKSDCEILELDGSAGHYNSEKAGEAREGPIDPNLMNDLDCNFDLASPLEGHLLALPATTHPDPNSGIEIVNQLLLPHTTEFIEINTIEQAHDAIKSMKIRGAPAIASLAALAVASDLSRALQADPAPDFLSSPQALESHVSRHLAFLYTARPTAVNLGAATRRLTRTLQASVAAGKDARAIAYDLIAEGREIDAEDVSRNKQMSKWGGEWLLERVKASGQPGTGLNVMTVCNTGSLATSGYGTALGLITYLHETGVLNRAYFTQSTPYHQGSRLTAFELQTLGIPSTMLCDSMVGSLFQHNQIHAIAVGADRIARNGDTANKVGTYNAAVLAARHKIPFVVVAPISTVDLDIADGSAIPIEHRPPLEACLVRGALYPASVGAQGVKEQATVMVTPEGRDSEGVYNPSFDVTPAELITAIVTEKGVATKSDGATAFDLSSVV